MPSLKQDLRAAVGSLEIQLTPEMYDALLAYLELLQTWNARINLTATREASELLHLHLVDSLILATHLPAGTGDVIDVGSGGGFPAIPTAILRSDLRVVAIEPVHKKHAFLSTARRELGLANFKAMPIRESAVADSSYDLATSRATFDIATWFRIGQRLVKPAGCVFAMEGIPELSLPEGVVRQPYQLPGAPTRSRAILRWPAGPGEAQ